jgi:DNA-binding CsgD family transcriptional regulator
MKRLMRPMLAKYKWIVQSRLLTCGPGWAGLTVTGLACGCITRRSQGAVASRYRVGAPRRDEHVRVSVLVSGEEPSTGLLGTVVLSTATDLRGLTPRELEALGLLIDGRSNQQIAHALVVAPRTVAAHIEHILAKLGVSTRTLAAVRAERDGLYVPATPRRRPQVPHGDGTAGM